MRFELVTLGDYLLLQKGISYTSSNLVDNSDTGLLTINAFTLGGGYKPNSEKPFEGNIEKEFLLSDGDVLVAMTEQDSGLLASPLVVKIGNTSFERLTFSLDVGRFMKKKEGLEPRFVFNLLRIPAIRNRAAYGDSGSTVQRLPYEALYEQKVPKPTLEIQRKVINFIDMIDEKIFTNNALSKTLEDIAQTIFKSWFIDFDPVRAKMNGEKPIGMDDETAALFPDSLEESELGLIPKGWSTGKFGESSNLLMGQSPPGDSYNSDGVGLPFYQGRTDFGFRFPKRRIFCTQENRVAQAGETLISVRAPVGDINQAIEKCIIGRGVASVMHKSGSEAYSYSLLKSLSPVLSYYNGEGTVFGAINRNDFHNLLIVEPSQKVVKAYDRVCSSINDEVRTLHLCTETLIEVRDSLLPRLISGELQIPEEMLAS